MVINGRNDNNEHYHLVMTEAWLSIESTKSMDLMPFVTQLGLVRLVNSECECGKRVPYPRQLFFGICGSLASQSCRFPGRIFFSRACLVYFGPRNLDTSVQRRTHVGHVQITQKRKNQWQTWWTGQLPNILLSQLWPNKNSELATAMGYTIWLFNIAMENHNF